MIDRLLPGLLQRVDDGEIRMTQAVDLSSLRKGEQEILEDVLSRTGMHISIAQARKIKALSEEKAITTDNIVKVLSPEEILIRRVVLSREFIDRYFPAEYTSERVMDIVTELIAEWRDY